MDDGQIPHAIIMDQGVNQNMPILKKVLSRGKI